MKRTNYWILCGTEGKYGYAVYRTAMKDEKTNKYFVRWKNNLIDVTEDIEKHNYVDKSVVW